MTHGNLCIKGRFGFQFVQNDRGGLPPPLAELRPAGARRVRRRRVQRPRRRETDDAPSTTRIPPIARRARSTRSGRVPVAGADGWRYEPFEHDDAHNLHRITLVREEDGEEVVFTMPDFVEQGDELGEIALLVIRARERWRELKGVGG